MYSVEIEISTKYFKRKTADENKLIQTGGYSYICELLC